MRVLKTLKKLNRLKKLEKLENKARIIKESVAESSLLSIRQCTARKRILHSFLASGYQDQSGSSRSPRKRRETLLVTFALLLRAVYSRK